MQNFENALTDLIKSVVKETLSSSELNEQPTSQPAIQADEYLNTLQAMKFLDIKSVVTLQNRVKVGAIPAPTKNGRKNVYKLSDLKTFLDGGR